MTRSQRISKIAGLSRNKERQAARHLANAQDALKSIKDKLDLMLNYRQEYMDLLQPNGKKVNVRQVQERQAFILQMDEGISLLKKQLTMQQQMTEQECKKWLQAKHYIETMDTISERFASAERRISELRQQHELDELSGTQWHSNNH